MIAVVRSGLSAQLMDKFYGCLDQRIPQPNTQPFVKSFLAGGLYKMLMDWMENDCQTPTEEMAVFLAAGSQTLTRL